MSWSYTGGDPGLALFTACRTAGAPLSFVPGGHYLEVGCNEANWLTPAAEAWPEAQFIGIDWRATDERDKHGRIERRKANGLEPGLFAPETFDGIVSLSAIEHFGLGHYARDPVDPYGDTRIISNCWRWLKPGGWLYFDVPYDPTAYRLQGTECRVYDDHAILTRLKCADLAGSRFDHAWREVWVGWAHAKKAGVLVNVIDRTPGSVYCESDRPQEAVTPFHYVAMVWVKV